MRLDIRAAAAALVGMIVTLSPIRATAAEASIQSLGFVPTSVSADGSVVVGWSSTGIGQERAVRWTRAGGVQDLGGVRSLAHGVSADGSVVVGTVFSDAGSEAVRWMAGGMERLGDLPGGRHASGASGVSADGSVVVGAGHSGGPDNQYEAFRWTATGGMHGLGLISDMHAVSVSGDGSVVAGNHGSTSGHYEAFRWTQASGMQGLGDLPGGAFASLALAISADGSTIVGASPNSSAPWEPFRWTESGGMQALGPPSTGYSAGYGVSGDGSVVVGYDELAGAPFFWDAAHGTRSLQQVLANDYGLDLTGWTLLVANGISADGRAIVGTGASPSGGGGWLVTIPEPCSSLTLLGPGTALLRPRRWRPQCRAMGHPPGVI